MAAGGCDTALTEALSGLYTAEIVAAVCEAGCTTLQACATAATPLALTKVEDGLQEVAHGLNTAFLLFSAYLVFMM